MHPTPTPRRGTDRQAGRDHITIVVADGDALARRQIVDLLRRSGRFTVVGEARDGVEGLELARHYRPDLLVCEAMLPRLDGIALIAALAAEAPDTRPVVLTVGADDERALDALRAGAAGVLSKEIEPRALVRALIGVVRGEAAISRRLAMRLVERIRLAPEPGRGVRPVRGPLTTREWEVLDLVATGATSAAIADTLVLSEETVSSHVKNIRRKLGVRSRGDAVRAARELLAGHGAPPPRTRRPAAASSAKPVLITTS